ncbi:MAG: LEPR-XLL domain-containing protein, partial [Methylomonas sp.]|nr:LEPR-XLL domain-containing protein [Methylomonas sp.]
MRKSVEKNEHPERSRNFSLSPLMHDLLKAFRSDWQAPTKTAQDRPPLAVSSQPAIRFETIESRVLLSGDVNPAALSINGAISIPGEQDQYEFLVEEPRRVVFDSLTNRSDLNWKLEGPNGQLTSRSFKNTDYQAESPAFELTPGKYKVTVDGNADAVGDYSLRIVDADAAADLTPGTEASGSLDGGNKSAVYRFQAKAGDKFFFDALTVSGNADWRLIDPYGRQEGSYGNLKNDRDTFTLQYTGEYLMLVEGDIANTAALNYSFNLRPVTDSTEALALGAAAIANIDQPGKTDNFTFSLPEPQAVLFDRLTNSDFYWSLNGPEGVVVSRTYASYGASNYAGGYGRLFLPTGDYTLSIDVDGTTTGSFPFRLLADDGAESLETGVATSAVLDNARGTQLYKLALNEGDKIFVDGRSLTGGALNWTLVDSYGVQLASSALMTAQAPLTVGAGGDYWLVLDGADGNLANAIVSYQFAINKVPDVAATLTLGSRVSGSVDLAGQATVYSFELAAGTQVAFDAQSTRSDMRWSLIGPRGTEVSMRRFDQSDAGSAISVMNLPAGSYRLV